MSYECKYLVRDLEGLTLGGVDGMKRDLGEFLDDGKIIRVLGEGVGGEACLVNYEGQTACLKVGNMGLENELLSEAESLYNVNGAGGSPRLLAVSKDGTMLVMEYCEGPTLYKFSKEASADEMNTVAEDVKLKLLELHNSGYTHNDIHSGNIIVCGTPGQYYTRLIDFGMARKLVKNDAVRDLMKLDEMLDSVKENVRAYRRIKLRNEIMARN